MSYVASDEAIAAYPETEWTSKGTILALRHAFDQGRASVQLYTELGVFADNAHNVEIVGVLHPDNGGKLNEMYQTLQNNRIEQAKKVRGMKPRIKVTRQVTDWIEAE